MCRFCVIETKHDKRMQQTNSKGVYNKTRVGREGNTLGIVQKLKYDYSNKWYIIIPAEWNA